MSSYCAFLGNQPCISIAELAAALPDFTLTKMLGTAIAVFESSSDIKQKHLNVLGGTILIAKQIPDVKSLQDIPGVLLKETANVKGKITFSLRAYGVNRQSVFGLYRDGKKYLVKHGKPVRYVGNERMSAAAALLHGAGIVDGTHGCELTLLGEEKWLWVGRTVAVQDIDAYTKRDMEKPVRDTRVGLLPPKLAQILLNFGTWAVDMRHETLDISTKKKASSLKSHISHLIVFDPFCGTGVIPIECMLRGWNVLASDLSLKAVNGCEKNIEWARKEYKILKKNVPATVWRQDASKPFALKQAPDVIVTETTLGPPLSKQAPVKEATKMRNEVDAMELAFLKNVAATLPGVPVVATFPVWYVSSGPLYLEKTWSQLKEIGFKAMLPAGIATEVGGQPSLVYRRSEQFVGRQIVVLLPLA